MFKLKNKTKLVTSTDVILMPLGTYLTPSSCISVVAQLFPWLAPESFSTKKNRHELVESFNKNLRNITISVGIYRPLWAS